MVAHLNDLRSVKRLVIKIGSALLVQDGAARKAWIASLAKDIAALREQSEIIIVSSGAIALGAAQLGFAKGGRSSLADAQAAASVGQVELARQWSEALGEHGLTAAQILLTLDDLEDRRRYLNASATLGRLLDAGAVPVINENDSVATQEIRFGDNDRLAARVAQAVQADGIILLSDVDGLYDRMPDTDAEGVTTGDKATLVETVDGIDASILAMAKPGSSSGLGSGGMRSKLEAAQIAERAGITLAIINGTYDAPLTCAFESGRGTIFLPQRNDNARKAWLGGRMAPVGTLRVDKGCEEAMRKGASLLAAGIIGVSGEFHRSDLVRIDSISGAHIAQGLVEYEAAECMAIAGKREEEQHDALGYAPRPSVVHRDHMVLL